MTAGARRRARGAVATPPGLALRIALGTLLGAGSVVTALGLAATVAARASTRLDALAATEVVVRDRYPGGPEEPFPPDAGARLGRLDGVLAAGQLWTTRLGDAGARRTAGVLGAGGAAAVPVAVVAAGPDGLRAAGAAVGDGRLYDAFHVRRAEPVALLGARAAERLGISDLRRRPAVFLGEQALTVIGLVERADRRPDLLGAVIVPPPTAARMRGLDGATREILIHTAPGAAGPVARRAAAVLRPEAPDRLDTLVVPAPGRFGGAADADLAGLLPLLAALSLATGAAMATAVALALRRGGDPGRAPPPGPGGRWRLALRLLAEGAALGALGGLLGAGLGALVVVEAAAARRWPASVEPALVPAAALLGALAGALAGIGAAPRRGGGHGHAGGARP